MEHTYIVNGRFYHNLNGWTVSGGVSYSAGDGDDHYGVAVLPTGGETISQDFGVIGAKSFTLHLSVKAVGASLSGSKATATVTDGNGNTVKTSNLTGTADTWTENTITVGLAEGTTYNLTITNASATGDVKVDDVWLWYVPVTRSDIAARVAAKLGRLASDRSLSTSPSGALTEGDYTYAIDAGLRAVGAIDSETDLPDVRYLDGENVKGAIDTVTKEMLSQLALDYAAEVDITVGPQTERLSQKNAAIAKLIGGDSGGSSSIGGITQRVITYE